MKRLFLIIIMIGFCSLALSSLAMAAQRVVLESGDGSELGTASNPLSATIASGSVSNIADADGDTSVDTEKNSDEDIIRFDTAGSERMTILASGSVGIGTSEPEENFTIEEGNILISDINASGIAPFLEFKLSNNFGIRQQFNTSNASLTFQTNNGGSYVDAFTILRSNGNIGIGTVSPTTVLEVAGTTILGSDSTDSHTLNGVQTKPNNPAFYAFLGGLTENVTGDNTTYTVAGNSERYDIGGNYDTSTFTFTAPVTGKYAFTAGLELLGVTSSHVEHLMTLNTSNINIRIASGNTFNQKSGSNALMTVTGSVQIEMEAADTATLQINVSGGTKVVDIQPGGGGSESWFSGYLMQ